MNKLSWMLYLCDFVESFNTLLLVSLFFGGFFLIAFTFYLALEGGDEGHETPLKLAFEKTLLFWAALVVLAFVSCLIPSKKTMYLMIGSEASEAVAASEVGQQVISIIKGKISELEH